ncbi:hypothetical protein MFU01_18600 [Myxococcus fulvus]|uniref:Uncharacterized protein n=1 Tax=Myxococcus fulvus TaxID=33 RepID=A0A511SZT2_MYXFU|nr:hypothetical protein MFU01_18600 [Myxococcus fulvus]
MYPAQITTGQNHREDSPHRAPVDEASAGDTGLHDTVGLVDMVDGVDSSPPTRPLPKPAPQPLRNAASFSYATASGAIGALSLAWCACAVSPGP